jgi:anti-anti-sigma regulatory factor
VTIVNFEKSFELPQINEKREHLVSIMSKIKRRKDKILQLDFSSLESFDLSGVQLFIAFFRYLAAHDIGFEIGNPMKEAHIAKLAQFGFISKDHLPTEEVILELGAFDD